MLSDHELFATVLGWLPAADLGAWSALNLSRDEAWDIWPSHSGWSLSAARRYRLGVAPRAKSGLQFLRGAHREVAPTTFRKRQSRSTVHCRPCTLYTKQVGRTPTFDQNALRGTLLLLY
jgi:hypothetical protein